MLRKILIGVFVLSIVATGLALVAEEEMKTMKIGSEVTDFTLPNTQKSNEPLSLTALATDEKNPAKAVVVMFIATKCPISNDYNARMEALHEAYSKKGIRFVGVNSNESEPVPEIVGHSKQNKFTFPVLKDMDNKIADVFGARYTPEIYLLEAKKNGADPKFILRYHGRIDDSQDVKKVSSKDLEIVLDAFLAGKPIEKAETKAFGCTIKRIKKGKPSATP